SQPPGRYQCDHGVGQLSILSRTRRGGPGHAGWSLSQAQGLYRRSAASSSGGAGGIPRASLALAATGGGGRAEQSPSSSKYRLGPACLESSWRGAKIRSALEGPQAEG